MRPSMDWTERAVSLVALLLLLGACTDEKIIFQDRELFENPPAAALGFLGYSDQADKLTVCGNCHVGVQSEWEETAHASAWAGLQDSGAAQSFCEGCHTTNELGNLGTVAAGYNAVPDDRYLDVQCESCHNAGLDHVTNPDSDANKPLATAAVSLELESGCGQCHSGSHHPFAEEWEQSPHAAPWGEFFPGGFEAGSAAAFRDGCNNCHTGSGALTSWGVNADYIEKGEILPVNCVVCHDPHGSVHDAQLRFPIGTPNIEENLCARCHNRRSEPDPNSSHGLEPHSPETGLLQGDVGWFPPGLIVDRGQIVATHGTEQNPSLCATCHVNSFTVTDAETGDFVFSATGHLFKAIPCVAADGTPTPQDCDFTEEARSFEGCVAGGCHGSEQTAFAALSTAALRIQTLAEELHDLLEQVDPNLDGAGGEIDATNPEFTVAEGAFFNVALAEFPERDRPDPRLVFAGSATHNPFLMEQLLISSIRAVEEEYALAAAPSLILEPLLPGN